MELNIDLLLSALEEQSRHTAFYANNNGNGTQQLRHRGATDVRFLVQHPRNQDLMQEGGAFFHIDRTKRSRNGQHWGLPVPLKGLTKLLQQFFWESFTHWKKTQSPEIAAVQRAESRAAGIVNKADKAKKKASGFASAEQTAHSHIRGSILHRQLAQWVTHDRATYKKLNPGKLNPRLELLLKTLQREGIIIIAVEYKVACTDPAIRLGTAIDIVGVYSATGKLVFIELKTAQSGTKFYMDEPAIPFTNELEALAKEHKLTRSPLTRAQVQLALSICMAVEGLGLNCDFAAFVLLVAERPELSAKLIPVPIAFLTKVGGPLYQHFKAHIIKWRSEQQDKKKKKTTTTGAEKRPRDDDNAEHRNSQPTTKKRSITIAEEEQGQISYNDGAHMYF